MSGLVPPSPSAALAEARSEALIRDAQDPLRGFRERFQLPEDLIYLDGNSLGALPKVTVERVGNTISEEWGQGLIQSWNTADWVDAPRRVGDKIGRLIDAQEGETLVADSTSVNLFKVLLAALALRPERRVILTEDSNFPTDLYIAEAAAGLAGRPITIRRVSASEIPAALNAEVAVVLLSHVNYRSGAMFDLAGLTAQAHALGVLTVWDLAHSAGAVPLALAEAGADFAVGCGYKYLNGGPGAPAFVYVARALQSTARSPIWGWFGHARPFAFDPRFEPAAGIEAWQAGTPNILGMAALESGVDLMLEAPQDELRDKSVALCERWIALADTHLRRYGFELASPRSAASRGSQVCLRHPDAWPINQALIAHSVIGDFRSPDILRLGFAPLYVRHVDVVDTLTTLERIMREGLWREARFSLPAKVT